MIVEPKSIEALTEQVTQFKTIVEKTGAKGDELTKQVGNLDSLILQLRSDLDAARRMLLEQSVMKQQIARTPQAPLTEDCAKFLGAMLIVASAKQQTQGWTECKQKDRLSGAADEVLKNFIGMEFKTALTTSDIPMPTNFAAEVTQLVWEYGQFRQFATVYPLSTLTTKLPKLTTSPAFSFMNASASVPEKSPQFGWVTFTANKCGGLVRFPSEIEEDSIVAIGQFLGTYIAREMARWEDLFGFTADASGTYLSISGVGKYADTAGYKIVSTSNNPFNVPLANLRSLRAQVNSAALKNAKYYCHPTMESIFAAYNSSTNLEVYKASSLAGPATLDGVPIEWIGVMPVNDGTTSHVNQYQVYFGDMSYWYLGTRRGIDIATSREAGFTTDEILIRALERIDARAMADDAMAVLKLAAS